MNTDRETCTNDNKTNIPKVKWFHHMLCYTTYRAKKAVLVSFSVKTQTMHESTVTSQDCCCLTVKVSVNYTQTHV